MSSAADIVLINPGGRQRAYQRLANDLAAVENPVWPGLIATFLRGKGFAPAIIDANALGLSPRETAEQANGIEPRVVAIVAYGHNPSASTQVMPAAREIAEELRELNSALPIVMLGGHVAALPERTLEEEPCDIVCTGEGTYALADLLAAYGQSARPDLSKVRGILYRDGGQVQKTAPAPFVSELDAEMPGIAWDLLPMQSYRAHNWHCFDDVHDRSPYASIYTTLGCPHRCTFCCIQAPFKEGERALGYKPSVNSYRRWSPDAVLAELDRLVQDYGVRNVKFADELFVLNPKHVHGIADGIIERRYDLNIWAYARVDSIKPGMLDKLRRAGVRWLALGIEAGSAKVRDDVSKGFAPEKLQAVIREIESAGIYTIGNYIFGLPEDDLESMQETLDLALELRCEMANFYCAMAYPGSALYRQAVSEGWRLPAEWSGYSQFSRDTLPLPTRHLSGPEVLAFRDAAFTKYFQDPYYLAKVERVFGVQTRQHIEDMAARPLVREHLVETPA